MGIWGFISFREFCIADRLAFIYSRIKALVKELTSYEQAKQQASKEVLRAFTKAAVEFSIHSYAENNQSILRFFCGK